MNRSNDAMNDGYAMSMYKRGSTMQRFEPKAPRSNAYNHPDRQLFKPHEDMAPFGDQLIQYNVTKPYKYIAQGSWNGKHYA